MSHGTGLALALIAALAAGCADQNIKQMTTRPKPGAGEAGSAAERRVVLFRAEVNVGDEPMAEPWALHWSGLRLFTVVGPAEGRLTYRHSFLPGRPDVASSDDGWAFLALPAGAYKLEFEGNAIRFAMAGSEYFGTEAVPVGRSPPAVFVVPPDASLTYIGTFNFTCHEPTSSPDALKLECTKLEMRDEAQLARGVAQRSLSMYGPMQEAPAALFEQKP
ncbi:MAG TPA: hypothetical protein VMH26_12255 [Burkholderiales bacterium]|nr:hypothetical protein [Burkholderiales bacterium]